MTLNYFYAVSPWDSFAGKMSEREPTVKVTLPVLRLVGTRVVILAIENILESGNSKIR